MEEENEMYWCGLDTKTENHKNRKIQPHVPFKGTTAGDGPCPRPRWEGGANPSMFEDVSALCCRLPAQRSPAGVGPWGWNTSLYEYGGGLFIYDPSGDPNNKLAGGLPPPCAPLKGLSPVVQGRAVNGRAGR